MSIIALDISINPGVLEKKACYSKPAFIAGDFLVQLPELAVKCKRSIKNAAIGTKFYISKGDIITFHFEEMFITGWAQRVAGRDALRVEHQNPFSLTR